MVSAALAKLTKHNISYTVDAAEYPLAECSLLYEDALTDNTGETDQAFQIDQRDQTTDHLTGEPPIKLHFSFSIIHIFTFNIHAYLLFPPI